MIITHYTVALPKNLYPSTGTFTFVPLHWCHDARPHSGTALYKEMDQHSTTPYRDCPVDFQAISQKVNRTTENQKVNRTTENHALHCSCLVSESTILYYYNTHVSSLQP